MSVVSLTNTADAFDDMSARTGVSVKALQELTYVSKLSGGSAESMEVAFRKMAMTITDAGEGMQQAKDQLKNLNLTFSDLAGLSPEDQFNLLAGAISDIKDPTARAAAAIDVFGRSGTSLLPMLANGRDGLQKMRDEASVFGTVLDDKTSKAAAELGDDIDRLTMGIKSLWDSVAVSLLPVVEDFVGKAKELIVEVKTWIKEHQALFDTIVKVSLVLGGFLAITGTLLAIVGSIVMSVAGFGIAMGALAGPVALIVAGIAALVVAGGLLITHWDAVKYYTIQAWEGIKGAVLTAVAVMLQGLTSYLSWVPGFGTKLKAINAEIQASLLASTKAYETNKANYEAQQAAKALAKQKADNVKTLTEDKKGQAARKLSHEEMIQSLSASWSQFQIDYSEKTMNWYAELLRAGEYFQSSLSAGFVSLFTNIQDGWSSLGEAMNTFGQALKTAMIQHLADMAAKWVMQHLIMSAATKAWAVMEIAWNAAVAAAKAAAASAWMLWGAIAVGAGMLAAIMGFAPKFEQGGIVGGTSYSGDNVLAAVNSGEMVLNRSQQARLFDMANGRNGGGGEQTIIINLDGKVIAKSTVKNMPAILRLYGAIS